MVLRQKIKKLSVLLEISEPVGLTEGVFVTKLTHPKLKGELTFAHSENVGREEVLKALDENIVGHIFDMIDVVGEMIHDKGKPIPHSPGSGHPAQKKNYGSEPTGKSSGPKEE